jgi:hypothetical protein
MRKNLDLGDGLARDAARRARATAAELEHGTPASA